MATTSASPSLVCNARFLGQELTGVQRYGREMLARLGDRLETVQPSGHPSPVKGHLWEQFTLPGLCRNRLLWSPGNTGPLAVRRQVVTLHDASALDHPEWFSRKFALWYQFLLPRLARRVRRVITVSEFSKQCLVEACGISSDQVAVIYNGIDARFRPSTPEELAAFRRKHQLERPYFLYLGSLEPRKNVGTLLKAWAHASLPGVELVLAGAAGNVFRDRGFAELPAATRLWGRVADEDLTALLTGALGFVFPSIYEGFGFPALEAMACGCPTVVSSTTSLPEVCGPAFDPVTQIGAALYVDPLDAEAMAQRLRELHVMDAVTRATLSRNGLARAAEFTWERAAAQTWDVLNQEMNAS